MALVKNLAVNDFLQSHPSIYSKVLMSNMLLFQQDSHLLTTKELAGKKGQGKIECANSQKKEIVCGKYLLSGKS